MAAAEGKADPSRWAPSFRVPQPAEPLRRAPVPTFSIIVTAYQAAAFIAESIESALAQTVPAHEIIVCDDGSTDDLEAALAPYRDEIVYIRKERGGTSSAFNVATAAASGEFVAVLDADDAYLPERLEALGALASARPDLEILTTDAYVETVGRMVGRFNENVPFAVDGQRAAILDRCFCAWPAYRRRPLVAAGGYDESLLIAHDWDAAIRLVLAGSRAGLVDEPLYRYRLRENSVASNRVASLRERVTMLERLETWPDLSAGERRCLARSLADRRRALLLTEAEAALRAGSADVRRRALALSLAPSMAFRERLAGLAAAGAPRLARRVLERRESAARSSRLERAFPVDEPDRRRS